MKKKISISIDEKTIESLDDLILDGTYRNKSHLIEFAVNKLIKEESTK